jgi:hypothetical protein
MKQVSIAAACAAAFAFAASPAGAQALDSAFITQVESAGNTAVIEQLASQGGNHATIDQVPGAYYYGGGGNAARVLQLGVGDSQVRLNQSGQMNDYTVRQVDGRNLTAQVGTRGFWDGAPSGGFNTVLIEQSGFDSSAWVDNGSGGSQNRAEVMQRGVQNQADIVQRNGSGNVARVLQEGVGNSSAWIYQSGQMNDYTIQQHDGMGLHANVNGGMMGYNEPGGDNNTVLIDQSGFDSGAWVNQAGYGSYNRGEIVQGGGGQNQANIWQSYTSNSVASIYQAGSNLQAGINQGGGGGNIATIRQGH